jgi:hypothetical protein
LQKRNAKKNSILFLNSHKNNQHERCLSLHSSDVNQDFILHAHEILMFTSIHTKYVPLHTMLLANFGLQCIKEKKKNNIKHPYQIIEKKELKKQNA